MPRISRRQPETWEGLLASLGHAFAEVFEPDRCFGVAGRAPVTAGRKRAAGANFGAVGNATALELTHLEEAMQEKFEPLFDGGQIVGAAAFGGQEVGPGAAIFVAPGVEGEEC